MASNTLSRNRARQILNGAAKIRILVVGEIVADDAHPGSVFVEAADAFTERKARNSRSTKTS